MRHAYVLGAVIMLGCGYYGPPGAPGTPGSTGAPGPSGPGTSSTQPGQLVGSWFIEDGSVAGYAKRFEATIYVPQGARNVSVVLQRGATFRKVVPRTQAGDGVEKFELSFLSTDVFAPGDEATKGQGVYVGFEVNVTADNAKSLTGQTSTQLQCPGGSSQAICNGVCNSLDEDPNNCGECGRTCVLDGSSAAGICTVGKCHFPMVQASAPVSCQSLCSTHSTGGTSLWARINRCEYDLTTGQPVLDEDEIGWYGHGLVTRTLNGVSKFERTWYSYIVPEQSSAEGEWTAQHCCCGEMDD